MSDQGDLFGRLTLREKYDDGTYPRDFWPWLDKNRHIFDAFVATSLKAQELGFPRWGAFAVINIMRWETALRESHQNRVKISNNSAPGLARLAMAMYPALRGFFRTHRQGKHAGRRLSDGRFYQESGDDRR